MEWLFEFREPLFETGNGYLKHIFFNVGGNVREMEEEGDLDDWCQIAIIFSTTRSRDEHSAA